MTDITWTTEQRKLSDLVEWEHNPAEITDHDAQQLKRSINKFGLALPLIANVNGGLIDGHQRKMVMLMLDGHLPSELVDVRIPSRELSEDERTELAVRLRKNVGDWNWDTLANEFEIDDLKDWGFTDVDFELAGWDTEEEPLPDPGTQIDKAAELQEKWGTVLGQVWELGDHRLVCGDCTDAAVVERVMGGEKAGAVVTDPPYGINLDTDMSDISTNHRGWKGSGKAYSKIVGDDVPFDPACIFANFDYCQEMFLWGADYYADKLLHRNDGSWLVWDKASNLSGGRLEEGAHSQFELCWSRKRHKRVIIRKMWRGLFGTESQDIRERIHPTQKPVEVIEWILSRYTQPDWLIFDGFLGSGTTLIACERLSRCCRAIEIEPKYVAVTLQRWMDMTGREPVLEE